MQQLIKAKEYYQKSDSNVKAMLVDIFGTEALQSITDRVKSVEDAYKIVGKTRLTVLSLPEHIVTQMDLEVVIEALNEGWVPDWDNDDEQKWWPWFHLDGDFRFCDAYYDCADSSVGSRLCFQSRELCLYATKQFLYLYKTSFTK